MARVKFETFSGLQTNDTTNTNYQTLPLMTIKCKYCKQSRTYKRGELVYKHEKYIFCSYNCRSKWKKEQKRKEA